MYLTVLTGDIVASTSLKTGVLETLMSDLDAAVTDIRGWSGTSDALAIFGQRGGDGWQVALGGAHPGLRAALFLQARLRRHGKKIATRIAIASGEGTLPDGPRTDINTASGDVFTASGRLLPDLHGHRLMAHASNGALGAAVTLADHIAQGWTMAQARAICEILPPASGTHVEVAARLGISRQAVDQALRAAGHSALRTALSQLEAI